MSRHRRFSVAGGYRAVEERLALLAQEPATPHRPRPLPAPDAGHFARLAADKRREARSILRHVRGDDLSPAATFARRQARELLDQADAYEALGQGGAA